MKILVTGGAGFIGSHLRDMYVKEGHEVTVFDRNLMEKAGDAVRGTAKDVEGHVRWIEGDLLDQERVIALFKHTRFDLVSHHAAKGNVRGDEAVLATAGWENVMSTLNVLQAALKAKVPHFILASSGTAVYGEPSTKKASELWTPLRPLSPYGKSKLICESIVKTLCRQSVYKDPREYYSTTFAILRYANVYGPRQKARPGSGVIVAFIERMRHGQSVIITGGGTQKRDFIYIDDVVEVNRRLLKLLHLADIEVNVGSGVGTSVNEVYKTVAELFGENATECVRKQNMQSIEIQDIVLDCQKIKELIGWTAQYDLKHGIMKTIQAKGVPIT